MSAALALADLSWGVEAHWSLTAGKLRLPSEAKRYLMMDMIGVN